MMELADSLLVLLTTLPSGWGALEKVFSKWTYFLPSSVLPYTNGKGASPQVKAAFRYGFKANPALSPSGAE